MNLWQACKSFFKIGVIGFGGGTALIPVIEKEIVQDKKLMGEEQFKEDMVLQGLTPGAFPIKTAATIGLAHSSYGAVAVAYSVTIFSMILAIGITAILTLVSQEVLTQIGYLSVGISAFIVLVIYKFVAKVPRDAKKEGFLPFAIILMIFSLIFSCSDKIIKLIALFGVNISLGIPVLSTAMILLLGVTFVFFTGFKTRLNVGQIIKYVIAITVVVLSILTLSENPIIVCFPLQIVLYVAICTMLIYAIIEDILNAKKRRAQSGETEDKHKANIKKPLIAIGIALIPLAVMTVVCACLPVKTSKSMWSFLLNTIVAVFTTFGGGTAFISVSEGIFVGGGFIDNAYFWDQVVPIGNALPGPLLVKMLGSIGFNFAYAAGAGMAVSLCYALWASITGFSVTVIVFLAVYIIFEKVKGLTIFNVIKRAILPLIAGLLIPTMLAMLINMIGVMTITGLNAWFALLSVALMTALCAVVVLKTKLKDPLIILMFAVLSIGVCNILKVTI